MEATYKYHCSVVKINDKTGGFTCLGFVNGNSIAEIKRHVKKDSNYRYRKHGLITICDNSGIDFKMNSNLF